MSAVPRSEALGPRWNQEEVLAFFQGFLAHGTNFEKISAGIPNRTPQMVEGLYLKNKGYLSLPSNCIFGEALWHIMQDHYNSIPEIEIAPPSAAHASEGSGEGETRRSQRKRKRTEEGSSEDSDSYNPRRRNRQLFPESSGKRTPRRVKQDPLGIMSSPPRGFDERGMLPYEDLPESQYEPLQRRLLHALSGHGRLWCLFEFFYAGIDRPYFARNEFVMCLDQQGLAGVAKMTRAEWNYARLRIGKPRRLSNVFLTLEREKLERNRRRIREIQNGAEQFDEDPEMPPDIIVGQRVSARHPSSRQVHGGKVLTVDSGMFRVQFDRADLGVALLRDTDIAPHDTLEMVGGGIAETVMMSPVQPSQATPPARTAAVVHRLLDLKQSLLAELKDMNGQAETIAGTGCAYSDAFDARYKWVVNQLDQTNRALQPELRALRPTPAPATTSTQDIAAQCLAHAEKMVRAMGDSMRVADTRCDTDAVQPLVTACIALLYNIQVCAEWHIGPNETANMLDQVLETLRPRSAQNMEVFNDVKMSVNNIKASLSGFQQGLRRV